MKKEEAIQILSTRDWSGMLCGYTSGYTEALDMAVEALKAEPANGRIINADKLKNLLEKRKQFFIDAHGGSFRKMSEKDKARCDEIDTCIALITNTSTVSVALADRPQGVWKRIEYDGGTVRIECSRCGRSTGYGRYCKYCGAKMRVENQ